MFGLDAFAQTSPVIALNLITSEQKALRCSLFPQVDNQLFTPSQRLPDKAHIVGVSNITKSKTFISFNYSTLYPKALSIVLPYRRHIIFINEVTETAIKLLIFYNLIIEQFNGTGLST